MFKSIVIGRERRENEKRKLSERKRESLRHIVEATC